LEPKGKRLAAIEVAEEMQRGTAAANSGSATTESACSGASTRSHDTSPWPELPAVKGWLQQARQAWRVLTAGGIMLNSIFKKPLTVQESNQTSSSMIDSSFSDATSTAI